MKRPAWVTQDRDDKDKRRARIFIGRTERTLDVEQIDRLIADLQRAKAYLETPV